MTSPTLLGGPLLPAHREHLRASGLDDETIATAGIRSLDERDAEAAGFPRGLRGIGFPYPGTAVRVRGREIPYYRLRVDADRVRRDGQKYENPLGNRIEEGLTFYPYVPPGVEGLRKDAGAPIVVTEGEKKGLKLTQEGFPAIGLPGVFMFCDPRSEAPPERKPLHPELKRWRWRDRVVYLCFDSDRVEKDAVAVAHERLCRRLTEAGALVRVVRVPGLRGGPKVGADDFLVAHGPEAFRQFVLDARPWAPWTDFLDLLPDALPVEAVAVALAPIARRLRDAGPSERRSFVEVACARHPHLAPGEVLRATTGGIVRAANDGAEPPRIQVNDRQVRDIVDEAWAILRRSPEGARLFRRGRGLVFVDDPSDGSGEVLPADASLLAALLNRAATWVSVGDDGERNARLPVDVVRDMVALPDARLARLDSVVRAPVFLSDGRPAMEGGYHAADRLYHLADPALLEAIPELPEAPTPEHVAAARDLLFDDLLADFPFASESARAHALAALLQPFVRRLVRGPTPMVLVEAPSEGTGKGLLAAVIHQVATGRPPEPTTLPRGEDEIRKKITSMLVGSPEVVLIDNVAHALDSESLAAALTAEEWVDRRLGQSEMLRLPNRALWLVTANNPVLSRENARRAVRVRLDAAVEEPWRRTSFKHARLLDWLAANRGRVVGALLTLSRSWLAAGSPTGTERLGSFEGWSAVLGGIVEYAGVPGFLADRDAMAVVVDPEEAEWGGLVAAWAEGRGGESVDARELMDLAAANRLLGLDERSASDAAARSRFSKALAKRRDRVYGGCRIVLGRDAKRRQNCYRLEGFAVGAGRQEVRAEDGEAA